MQWTPLLKPFCERHTCRNSVSLKSNNQLSICFQKVLRPFLLRRLKKEVESQLPEKVCSCKRHQQKKQKKNKKRKKDLKHLLFDGLASNTRGLERLPLFHFSFYTPRNDWEGISFYGFDTLSDAETWWAEMKVSTENICLIYM